MAKAVLNGVEVELNPREHGEVIPVPPEWTQDSKAFLDWHQDCIIYFTTYVKMIENGEIEPNRIDFIKNLPVLDFSNC